MQSRLTPRYHAFRDQTLSLAETENLRSAIIGLLQDGKSGFHTLALGPTQRRFKVFVYISQVLGTLVLLGGHLERPGDPKPGYLEQVRKEVRLIEAEEKNHER
jgi:hypothetical protein